MKLLRPLMNSHPITLYRAWRRVVSKSEYEAQQCCITRRLKLDTVAIYHIRIYGSVFLISIDGVEVINIFVCASELGNHCLSIYEGFTTTNSVVISYSLSVNSRIETGTLLLLNTSYIFIFIYIVPIYMWWRQDVGRSQQTQTNCLTFIRCWANVEDVEPGLYNLFVFAGLAFISPTSSLL